MKIKLKGETLIAQCSGCRAVKMDTKNKRIPFVWQLRIAIFPNLPEEQCYRCKVRDTISTAPTGKK